MRDDLRAAYRSLRSTPTLTAAALVVIAFSVGVGTAIFSVVDVVLLRPLPFPSSSRLVAVGVRMKPDATPAQRSREDPLELTIATARDFLEWSARQQVFESIAGTAGINLTIREPGSPPEELRGLRVTADFFDVIGVHPRLGHAFGAEHEIDGRHRIAVLSDGFWRRRFGADPNAIGSTIQLEGGMYEVSGVMPPGFEYPIGETPLTEVWVPLVIPDHERLPGTGDATPYLQIVARLKQDISLEQAQQHLAQVSAGLAAAYPREYEDKLAGLRPLRDHIVGASTRQWMLMMLGLVALVLLIATANVANLLLARAAGRTREFAVRAAIGASRWRVIRQLLVESLALSAMGLAAALPIAGWGVSILSATLPASLRGVASPSPDLRLLAAAGLVALATGLSCGILPALRLSRPDLNALGDASRSATRGRSSRSLQHALVASQIAFAVVLLVGAALFIGSFRRLLNIDPGFDAGNLLTVNLVPRLDGPAGPPDYSSQVAEIVDRLRRTPGVRHAAAVAGGLPQGQNDTSAPVSVPGRAAVERADTISVRRVTPDYHVTMGIRLVGGRYFESTDRGGSEPVAIINQAAAARHFPGEDAVGRTIAVNGNRTIIGVVRDSRYAGLETSPRPLAYLPMAQSRILFSELVLKTTDNPLALLPAVRAAVSSVMPGVPLRSVQTMAQRMGRRTAARRLSMLLVSGFGLLGLIVSAVGAYGVMAHVTSQRTREIGVRMALGATPQSILGLLLRSAAVWIMIGLTAGAAGAWHVSAAARAFLFEVDANDPRAFAAALGALAAAALVASIVPARRAAAMDPVRALRID